jgi:hypothetical protein
MAHDDIRDLTIAPGAAPENEQALGLSSRLLDEIAAARGYRAKSKAANTLRAYQAQSARSCDFGHVEEQRLNMAIYQARSCPPIS